MDCSRNTRLRPEYVRHPALMPIMMNNDIFFDARLLMRTTVTVDDALYEKALELADPEG